MRDTMAGRYDKAANAMRNAHDARAKDHSHSPTGPYRSVQNARIFNRRKVRAMQWNEKHR